VILRKYAHLLRIINMSWNTFKDSASKYLNNKQIQDSLVLEKAKDVMIDIWGEGVEQKARVLYCNNNVLTIAIIPEELKEDFEEKKELFLEKLNKELDIIVKDLRFLS